VSEDTTPRRRDDRTVDGVDSDEEFVALLVEADPAAATAVAHRLRQCVERLGIVHEARPAPAIVTRSIGVAALCIAEAEDAGMLADADAMLYRAKSAGRNRVVS
jgi:diguanylate cyclase (GGDEF)-like protein